VNERERVGVIAGAGCEAAALQAAEAEVSSNKEFTLEAGPDGHARASGHGAARASARDVL